MAEQTMVALPGGGDDEPAPEATYQDVTGRGELRPIVAEQWQRHNLRGTVRHLATLHWHKARYHAARTHIYAGRTAWYSVRGAGRLTAQLHRWVHDRGLYELKSQAVAGGPQRHGEAMSAHNEIEKSRQRRSRVLLAYAVPSLAVVIALAVVSLWLLLLPLLAGVVVCVRAGRSQGKGVVDAAVVAPKFERLTTDIIVRGLGSVGIGALDKFLRDGGQIAFITPVQRDGPGWRVTFDLPYGVTAAEVIGRRDKLASGLRRPAGCVWPQEDAEHPGRMTLYVCDEPLAKMRQPAWPLGKAERSDIFQPLPFGTDQRGKPVSVELIWANLLIGSIPRVGKTVTMRNMLLAAALDARVELHVWELKGTGDLGMLGRVAHAYGSGPDDETLDDCLADVRKVHAELERRAKVIKGLPREVVPDSKVTPQLAARRSLRLHPLILAIDECQEAFSHPDLKGEFERLCLAIIRRGPALGIILILATQRPDANSLPTGISANVALRFCLKVMDDRSNNMVLGTGAYARGINSTLLAFTDRGVGWAVGFADAPMILKTYHIRGPAAEAICERARGLRDDAGVLSGYAAGESSDVEPRDVLGDVQRVFQGPGMHWAMLADRLADAFPERWAGATAESVSAEVRKFDVPSVPVKVAGDTQRGCRLDDVRKAAGDVDG